MSIPMSMDVPPDQNTAPVLEFRCLWTSDTRRKQKRWQDGRLKYHTFNKRVMVYDERSNFIGDTHWREKAVLCEGDELELERNGTLVEVSEYIESRDQDLTELIDKRVKEREERFAAKHGESSPIRPTASGIRTQNIAAAHLRPKPLNAILGTPTGHYGKAFVSTTSPFEQRQMLNARTIDENETPRPVKRRRVESPPSKSGFAQNLMGATLSFTPRPSSTGPIRHESLKLKSIQRPDESGRGGVDIGRETFPANRHVAPEKGGWDESSTRSRIHSRKKNSDDRSGYASSLTGASLSLSTTRQSTSRNVDRISNQKKITQTIDLSLDSSSDEDANMNIESQRPVSIMTAPKSRQVPHIMKEPRRKPPASIQHPSNPPVEEPVVTTRTSIPSVRQVSQRHASPVHQKELEMSHSSLRIRSRPRNKLMMFMDQPSSRSSPSTTQQRTARLVKDKAILPTMEASSPWSDGISVDVEKEDEPSGLPHTKSFADFEGRSSSPADPCIDQQVTDTILSRNRPPEVEQSSPKTAQVVPKLKSAHDTKVYDEPGVNTTNEQAQHSDPQSPVRLPEVHSIRMPNHKDNLVVQHPIQSIAPELTTSVPHISNREVNNADQDALDDSLATNKTLENTVNTLPPPVSISERTVTATTLNPLSETSIAVRAEASTFSSRRDSSPLKRSASHIVSMAPKAIANNGEGGNEVHSNIGQIILGKAINVPLAKPANIILDNPGKLHTTSNNSTFMASDRFMAKLMPAVNRHQIGPVPPKQTLRAVEKCQEPAPILPPDNTSSSVLIKQSPSSDSGFVSANQIVENQDQGGTLEASVVGEHGLSKPRLVNPATRGLSIQKTAKKTVQALTTTANTMAPPALGGTSGITTNNDIVSGTEYVDKGPWSRESFDLFGSWRPPVQQV